jgi:flavodoxin
MWSYRSQSRRSRSGKQRKAACTLLRKKMIHGEERLQVTGAPPRVLMVYYSSAGHTRTIAEQLAKAAQADLEELRAVGEPPGTGARHYLWALRHLLLSQKPALLSVEHDASTYDLIMLGSPVWLGTFSPVVRSYIRTAPLAHRHIALFCSYRNAPGPAFKRVTRMLRTSTVLENTLSFLDPVAAGSGIITIRAQRWVRELELSLSGQAETRL